jgi:hypothetical protein
MITFESAILQGQGKFNKMSPDGVNTYRQLFTAFRAKWQDAVEKYDKENGRWKDSTKIVAELRDHLLRIAVNEGLITLSSDMFTLKIPQMPQQGPGQQQGQQFQTGAKF